MQDALITVVVVVAACSGVVAIFTLLASGRLFGAIGSGGIEPAAPPEHGGGAGEREQEIRELLEARDALRRRHGAEPLALDAELDTLLAPEPDDGLRADARALVEARNRRRVRDGLEALDVEAEIDRQLRDLT